MRMNPANGDRSLLPGTETVKQKKAQKSLRASKQPAPSLSPRPNKARASRPADPVEAVRAQIRADAAPYKVPERVMQREVRNRQSRESFPPPGNQEVPWAQEERSFTLEVIRPHRPNNFLGVQFEHGLVPLSTDTAETNVLVRLADGQPYTIHLNGHQLVCDTGQDDYSRPNVSITIQAHATPEMLSRIGILSRIVEPVTDSLLVLPIATGHPVEICLDGELVLTEPGE